MATAAVIQPGAVDFSPLSSEKTTTTTATVEIQELPQPEISLPLAPAAIQQRAHEVIEEQVAARPNAPAVSSWDGYYTYKQLDELSSRLAAHLSQLGVGPEVIVPILCPKSSVTIIAMLAVAKAGGAFAALDISYPDDRLGEIVQDTKATVLLAAPSQSHRFAAQSQATVVEVSLAMVETLDSSAEMVASDIPAGPYNAMYLIFTSGSTGRPKGVVIEHSAFLTSALAHGSDQAVDTKSRVLQFSSYAFDISVMEIFTTLVLGGCIVVPADEDRYGGIAEFINRTGVNTAMLTPSYAKLLDPSTVPSLKTLVTVGEAVPSDLLETWSPHVNVYISYGPAEAAIQAAGVRPGTIAPMTGLIGTPTGCNIWIVKEDNHNELVDAGEIGELLIEGNILARGYLGDKEKTDAAFVPFVHGSSSGEKPRRAYKTGDLVRSLPDGTIIFVSRKDTQVKVAGMRFELTEIEARLSQCLPAEWKFCVEKVETASSDQAALATFISTSMQASGGVLPDVEWDRVAAIQAKVPEIREALAKVLPAPMVPSLYIPVSFIPLTPSAKTNRKGLRQLVKDLSLQDVQSLQKKSDAAPRESRPLTDAEAVMRELWSVVLNRDASTIGPDDSFIQLGGDSVTSIRLVALARERGVGLTSAIILSNPILSDVAKKTIEASAGAETIPAFALLLDPSAEVGLKAAASAICRLSADEIEDILPMAMTQMRMFGKTMAQPGAWVDQHCFHLPADVDLDKFQQALNATIQGADLLRAKVIATQDRQLYQVIERYVPVVPTRADDLEVYLQQDKALPMTIGTPLSRYCIVVSVDQPAVFVWTISHVIYDGYSISMLLGAIDTFYRGSTPAPFTPFNRYLLGPNEQDLADGHAFWKDHLAHTSWAKFPRNMPSCPEDKKTPVMQRLVQTLSIPARGSGSGGVSITTTNLLRIAYAATLLPYSSDPSTALFLEVLSGRNSTVPGIDRVAGPTLRSCPTKITFPLPSSSSASSSSSTAAEALTSAQNTLISRIRHESFPLQRLVPLLPTFELRSVLVIEDAAFLVPGGGLFGGAAGRIDLQEGDDTPVTFRCTIGGEGEVKVDVRFDESIVGRGEMEGFVERFGGVFERLGREEMGEREVGEVLAGN